jgi:hypothetical protein
MNHKRISKVSLVLTLVLLAFLVAAVPASAQAERIDYTSFECPISMSAPERQWVSEDGILHQRGIHLVNAITSSTPYLTGTNYLEMNTEINLATGEVHAYGKVDLHPAGYEGSWVGTWTTHVSAEGITDGKATIRGTGDLEGMAAFNTMHNPTEPHPACSNPMATSEEGYILVPHQ